MPRYFLAGSKSRVDIEKILNAIALVGFLKLRLVLHGVGSIDFGEVALVAHQCLDDIDREFAEQAFQYLLGIYVQWYFQVVTQRSRLTNNQQLCFLSINRNFLET